MSDKKIPVILGDIPIGRASVETMADGTKIVNVSIDNPDWGSWNVGGFSPMRLVGILPPNYQKGIVPMAAAEDRQARALEGIERHVRELHKIMAAMNDNLVVAFKYMRNAIESEKELPSPNQMSLDDMRAQAEKDQKDREQRAEYEGRTGEMWMDDSIEDSVRKDPEPTWTKGEGSE